MGSEAGALEDVRVIFCLIRFSRRDAARGASRGARGGGVDDRSVPVRIDDSRACAVEVDFGETSLFVHTEHF